jgi:hypothetical protein
MKRYKGFQKINEGIEDKDFFEIGEKTIALIKSQNELVQEAEDIFVEALDIMGHNIVPGYGIENDEQVPFDLDTGEYWEYVGMSIDHLESPEKCYREIMEFLSEMKVDVTLCINYQYPSVPNGWKALPYTDELRLALESVKERIESIGCEMEIEESKLKIGPHSISIKMPKNETGLYGVELKVPIRLDATSIVSGSVPKNVVQDFESFLKKYNIDAEGRYTLSKIIRMADYKK